MQKPDLQRPLPAINPTPILARRNLVAKREVKRATPAVNPVGRPLHGKRGPAPVSIIKIPARQVIVVPKPWQVWMGGQLCFLLSILVHFFFTVGALVLVVEKVSLARKHQFTDVTVSTPSLAAERQIKLTQIQRSQKSPVVGQHLQQSGPSPIYLPQIDLPADSIDMGKMSAAVLNETEATPAANPITAPASPTVTFNPPSNPDFATDNAFGLTGRFYDLRQTVYQTSTGMDGNKYVKVVADFVHGGWRDGYFNSYLAAPHPLVLPQLFVPYMHVADGAQAFGVDKGSGSNLWVSLYKGKIKVPKSITFRFVGYAADLCVVAINKKTILDASTRGIMSNAINYPESGSYHYTFRCNLLDQPIYNADFACGDWVHLEPGQSYDMDLLIGGRGGFSGFWLLIEEQNHPYNKTDKGSPILPLFRVSKPGNLSLAAGCPPFDEEATRALGWTVASSDDLFSAGAPQIVTPSN